MSPRMVALVKREPAPDRAARAMQAAFWRRFSTDHVHQFERVKSYQAFVCIGCGVMLRRVGG